MLLLSVRFFFQAEDGIRDLVRSRGLGDVYKRQGYIPRAPRRAGGGRGLQHRLLHRRREHDRAGLDLSLIHI